MEDSAFFDDFCRFIQTCVTSVDAAELLLQLSRHPETAYELDGLARSLAAIIDKNLSRGRPNRLTG